MRHSIFNRYFLSIYIPYVILTTCLLIIITYYSNRSLEDEIKTGMKRYAYLILNILRHSDSMPVWKILKDDNGNSYSEYRIQIIDRNGSVIYDTDNDFVKKGNHNNQSEFFDATKIGEGFYKRYSSTKNEGIEYFALPFSKDGDVQWVIMVETSLSNIKKRTDKILMPIIISGIIYIVITSIILFLLSRKIIKSLEEMLSVAKRINSGDLSVRLLNPPVREVKILYDTINHILFRISSLIKENENKETELFSVLSSVQEGLIILDREFKIIHTNNKIYEFFPVGDMKIEGKKIYELFKSYELNRHIQSVFNSSKGATFEISLQDYVFLVSISYNKYNDTVIILLYNITEKLKMERYKSEFIGNVSHELRTPLTAIKASIDTLEMVFEGETASRYLNIIQSNVDRLINIVNDLLSLSSIENQTELNLEDCNLNNIIEEIYLLFQATARQKNLLFTKSLTPIKPVRCDRYLIYQAIVNLVDNAIKYTDSGSINISTGYSNNKIILTVEDTGIGIPEEHLNRIFERFYVVDKSRSRTRGGTGLGLSITKKIVQRHNWDIRVKSQIGQGSVFQIIIPVELT